MRAIATLLFVFSVTSLFAAEVQWKPVIPEHLSIKAPKLDPEADAEVLFWETWVEDYTQGGYAQHRQENYLRIKLFTARAVERWGDVKVEYPASLSASVSGFQGRVIKADGSIVEVKGGQVKDITVAKTARLNIRAKSFAFPALQPGDIIEYKYTEYVSGGYLRYVRLPVQMDIPIWEVTHHVKPLSHPGMSSHMRSYPFNVAMKRWEPVVGVAGREGYVKTSLQSIPAFVREPQMPADDDVRGWIFIYYTDESKESADKYWPSQGRKLNEDYRRNLKINGEIKALAADLAGKAQTPIDKAKALAVYCQTKIRNTSYQAEGFKAQEREEFFKSTLKDGYSSADTLKNKIGRPQDIRLLFSAMAEAAGLNPVFVAASSSRDPVFRKDFLDPYFIRSNVLVGIPEGSGKLQYFNAGNPYLPAGMADAHLQGQAALICDPKGGRLEMIPASPAGASLVQRFADLTMAEDGSVSGKVRLISTGHFAVDEKREYDDQSPVDREAAIKKELEARYPGSQISGIEIENADKALGNFEVRFDIRMEAYGQRAGKRLFLQPAFFQFGKRAPFSASKRRHAIFYENPWSESDLITFKMPEGFALDAADLPGGIALGQVGTYELTGKYAKPDRKLVISRSLAWGNNGATFFEASAYPAIKQAWDKLHAADTHQITFRKE